MLSAWLLWSSVAAIRHGRGLAPLSVPKHVQYEKSIAACKHNFDGVLITLAEDYAIGVKAEAAGRDPTVAQYFVDTVLSSLLADGDRVDRTYRLMATIFAHLAPATLHRLFADDRVALVDPNCILRRNSSLLSVQSTADPRYVDGYWNLDRLDQRALPLNKEYDDGDDDGASSRVYILDTGIRITHEQFGGRAFGGWSAGSGANWVPDGIITDANPACDDHGTHCAGTVGGSLAGVAKQASLIAVQVLDCTGSGAIDGVLSGIEWAVRDIGNYPDKKGVISMSLGISGTIPSTGAWTAGASLLGDVVVTVAAGNDNANAIAYSPASSPACITTGATDTGDRKASFSNYGYVVDIWAPGVNILSTITSSDTAVGLKSGTSMACPLVAGVAAQIRTKVPQLTAVQVFNTITCLSTKNAVMGLTQGGLQNNRLLYGGAAVESPDFLDCVELDIPPQSPPPPSPAPSLPSEAAVADTAAIAGGIAGGVASVLIISMVAYCICFKKRSRGSREHHFDGAPSTQLGTGGASC